jgi:hypothetical protein
MKLYYEYRRNSGKQGWYVQWSDKVRYRGDGDLPLFFELNRDATAAEWARGAGRMELAGWLLGLASEAGFVYASATTQQEEFKPMWAYGLVPSALLTWGFHIMADKWFRHPAVNHYNRELKRELKVSPD